MVKEKKSKWWIGTLILIGMIVLVMSILQSTSLLRLSVESYGHGVTTSGGIVSLLQSLNIIENIDYTDVSGEEYCFNEICWIETEFEYGDCVDACNDEASDYCYETVENIYSDEYDDCMYSFEDGILVCERITCEDNYMETLLSDCSIRCEGEIYVWDSTPVTNLGEFAETAFPNFVFRSSLICNDWIMSGEWVSESDKVGCLDAGWIMCDSDSLTSAGEVCETIGYTWTCSNEEAFCS